MKIFFKAGIPPLKRLSPCHKPYKNHRWHAVAGQDGSCRVYLRVCLRCKLIIVEHISQGEVS